MNRDIESINRRCPHCYKLYRPHKPKDDPLFNYCSKGHRTLYLHTINKNQVQQLLNQDYADWVKFYRARHHWIRKIFDSKKKLFVKILRRDQRNLFELFPDQIDHMIQTAFDTYNKNN